MTMSAQHVIAVSGLVSGRADRLEPSPSISHNTDPASQEKMSGMSSGVDVAMMAAIQMSVLAQCLDRRQPRCAQRRKQ